MPLKKPHLTVLFSILVTLILSIGSIWILVDDDFVKMFPDNIKSKKVWDDIQNEFGSTEYLTVALSHNKILSIIFEISRNYFSLNKLTNILVQ